MKFTKMQGCGNDYIYVNCFEETVSDPSEAAVRLSDRHFGIGGDGLILIEPSERADAYMHMFNLDGSEGSMCGNGIRCVAKYIYDHGIIPEDRRHAVIDTKAGIRELTLTVEDQKVTSVTVDMGIPALTGRCREELAVNGKTMRFTAVDIGNPHAVVFLEDSEGYGLDDLPIEVIGPLLEHNERFSDGVNTEFIRIISRKEIDFRVWERGSGETLACGTGAAASVFAGIRNGLLENEVLVHLAGGDLRIRFDADTGHCFMTGPATEVFSGCVEL